MKCLMTDVYSNFKCIGGECSDTCCKGWKIKVDNETYKSFEDLEEDTRQWIYNNIIKDKGGKYEIKKRKDGKCSFLNENNLCEIILRKSDKYTSRVCQNYPRKKKKCNDMLLCTVSSSCPEVVKAIISRNTQIKYIFHENEEKINIGEEQEIFDILTEGLIASIEILQQEDLLLHEKYLLLLLLAEEIEGVVEKSELDGIKEIVEKYYIKEYRTSLVENLKDIFLIEIDEWSIISSFLDVLIRLNIEKDRDVVIVAKKALESLDSFTYKTWKDNYRKINRKYEKENLSVHLLFENFINIQDERSIYTYLTQMYILMMYIEFFKIFIYNRDGRITMEEKIRIVSEVSRIMGHTSVLNLLTEQLVMEDRTMNLLRLIRCLS